MGTLNWTVTAAGANNPNIRASGDAASGSFTTSASAANVTNLTAQVGQTVTITGVEAHWVRFGGRTAAVGSGHYLSAGEKADFEIQQGDAGAVSAIEG